MADNDTWHAMFHNLMRYLYVERGWRVPFMLRGQLLIPVGIAGIQRRPMNDNHPQRPSIVKE